MVDSDHYGGQLRESANLGCKQDRFARCLIFRGSASGRIHCLPLLLMSIGVVLWSSVLTKAMTGVDPFDSFADANSVDSISGECTPISHCPVIACAQPSLLLLPLDLRKITL